MPDYNYDGFTSNSYNLDKFFGPEIGTKAQDFTLSTLEDEKVKLLEFSGEFLVLELGSITCPLFQGRREGMSDLVARFSNVSFSVLYIREAHPGSNVPAHKNIGDKISCARELKNEDGEQRKILIDNIEGAAHKGYGGYPNAIFIINKKGCVVFRSDWNSVGATRAALVKLLNGEPAHPKSYFLPVKPWVAFKTLRRSGKGAVQDFLVGLPKLIWKNIIRRNFLLFIGSQKSISPDAEC
ncbi:MAG: redoxin domain-containing protein [Hyphomicrobiaceae bacterium]|nr:redoxin domain-containing protein [Hyphomicrobiaceae bacterium]